MMLSGRLRAVAVVARAWTQPPSTVSRIPLVVRFTDIDANVHLTNSRYPQMMDLGRADWIVRSGAGRRMWQTSTWPVAVEVRTRFLRELRWGTAYVLETTVTGRERRAVVFRQRFLVGDAVHAAGEVRVVCLKDGRVVAPEGVFGGLMG